MDAAGPKGTRWAANSGSLRSSTSGAKAVRQRFLAKSNAQRRTPSPVGTGWDSSCSAIVDLENGHGFEAAEKQINRYLSDRDFRSLCDLLLGRVELCPTDTAVLFLIHATAFAPGAYRISSSG